MILSAQTIRQYSQRLLNPLVEPFYERTVQNGKTFGLGPAGYDIRAAESIHLNPGQFDLGSAMERLIIPTNVLAYVKDKSSWARKGLCVQNTVIEPGWEGYLTLEYTNHSEGSILIVEGDPIAQIVFHYLDQPTDQPYNGKYQDQQAGPQHAIEEKKPD